MKSEFLNRRITMSNSLARAAHGLSLTQKRVISLALAHINTLQEGMRDITTVDGLTVNYSASVYAKTFGLTLDAAYQQMKASEAILPNITVLLGETGLRWVSSAQYQKANLGIVFTPEVCAHLVGLTGAFISYPLRSVADLRSAHGWRLYECIDSWKLKPAWTVSVENFCRIMDAPDSYKEDFASVRTRIIEPAVKAIKPKFESLGWDAIKEGRMVTTIRFNVVRFSKYSKHAQASCVSPSKSNYETPDSELEQLRRDLIADQAVEAEYRRNNPLEFFDDDYR